MRFTRLALLGLAAVGVASLPAKADTTTATYLFTSDHCTGGCLPSGATNMGTITLTDNGAGTVNVSVSLAAGFGFVSTGAGSNSGGVNASFFFNLTGDPQITYSNLTAPGWSIPNEIPVSKQNAGSYAGDGLQGQFDYALACQPPGSPDGCGNGGSDAFYGTLSFDVTATGGLTLASFNDYADDGTSVFAADVISSNGKTGLIDASLCTDCDGTGSTGGGEVPEPSSVMLFGTAMLGITFVLKRRFAKQA